MRERTVPHSAPPRVLPPDLAALVRARTSVIAGPPGSGRSHRLATLVDRSRAAGLHVVVTAPGPAGESGHAALVLTEELSRLEVSGTQTTCGCPTRSDEVDLVAVTEQAVRALDRPIVVAIDDVDLVDGSSIGQLTRLVAQVRRTPLTVAVVATTRDDADDPHVQGLLEMLARAPGRVLDVDPLTDDDVTSLVRATLHAAPGPSLRSFLEPASSRPQLVVELLWALRDDGRLRRHAGVVEVVPESDGPSPALTRRAGLQLARATPAERDLLVAVALSPWPVPSRVVADAIGAPRSSVPDLVRRCASAWIVDTPDGVAFLHPSVAAAVAAAAGPSRRGQLHELLAAASAAGGRSALAIAHHLAAARDGARDASVARWLLRAASEQVDVDVPLAVDLLSRARSFVPVASPLAGEVALALARVLVLARRFQEAEAVARDGVRLTEHAGTRGELHVVHVRALALQLTREADVLGAADDAVADPSLPSITRAELECLAAAASAGLGHAPERVLNRARTALHRARHVGVELVEAHLVLASQLRCVGELAGAREHALAAVHAGRRADTSGGEPHPIPEHVLFEVLLDAGEIDGAQDVLDEALHRGQVAGADLVTLMSANRVNLALARGELAQALELHEHVLAGFRARGDPEPPGMHLSVARWLLEVGRTDDASRLVEQVRADPRSRARVVAAYLAETAAAIALARGDVDAAARALHAIDDPVGSSVRRGFAVVQGLIVARDGVEFVRLATATGDPELRRRCREVVSGLTDKARRWPSPLARLHVAWASALVAQDPGPLLTEDWLAEPRLFVVPRATLHADLGSLVARTDPEGALPHLQRAYDLYARAGSELGRHRVAARIRGAGGRHPRTSRPRVDAGAAGWASLTPAERRVVEAIGRGLTNARAAQELFLSQRTVETHLRNVYAKLGIDRPQLIADVARGRA